MKQEDTILHKHIHENMMRVDPKDIFTPRVHVFEKVERVLKRRIGGVVLDVGSGSGYASIWLAKNRKMKRVFALEASDQAVRKLLPRNIRYHNVGNVVEPVLASFDNIPFHQVMDFVVAFGALHHSPCLWSTMRSISGALKEGGYLIAQEPVMPNNTTNAQYIRKYDIMEKRFGIEIRNGDRDDHFFRESEYITAAAFSGLDLIACEDYVALNKSRFRTLMTRMLTSFFSIGNRGSRNLERQEHRMQSHPKIWVFAKNGVTYIPHLWKPLLGPR